MPRNDKEGCKQNFYILMVATSVGKLLWNIALQCLKQLIMFILRSRNYTTRYISKRNTSNCVCPPKSCTRIFITTFFIITKNIANDNYSMATNLTYRMYYINKMEHYRAMK